VIGVALAAAALLGLGGYFFLGKESKASGDQSGKTAKQQEEPSKQVVAEATRPEVKEEPDAVKEVPAQEAPAQSDEVVLHVATSPVGAVVTKDGFQVCDATPCDVMVKKGDPVTLLAEKGASKGEAKVLAQTEQAVTITLTAPRVATPRPRPQPAPAQAAPALCEVMVDGIKILRPCQ
jgi:hypothetical protein